MRTIKRCSFILNKIKLNAVNQIALAYRKEKKYWLGMFQQHQHMDNIKTHRVVRDQFVSKKYQSPYGLQARMWKLALIDAAETMDKYWQSLFDNVKSSIYRNQHLSKEQKHYCFWLLKDYQKLFPILQGNVIEFNKLDYQARKQAIQFLKRTIKKNRKSYPVAKLNRSFALDDNCYSSFEHHGKQYIKIMSLQKGSRIILPLKGRTPIKGNIRIIINDKTIDVHYTASLKKALSQGHAVIGIDLGYTEVLTDSEGNHYGKNFGNHLTKISDWLKKKMQKRHKLHALQKKYSQSKDKLKKKKARNIQKINLGKEKLNIKIKKHKATSLTLINTAFNEMLQIKAKTIISEDLSRPFQFGQYKNMNRRLSSWIRSSLKERLSFKALIKGFDHKQVNPAYTSQTCPCCGYV